MFAQALEGNVLIAFGDGKGLVVVLTGEKAFWNRSEQGDRRDQHDERNEHRDLAIAKDDLQRAIIDPEHSIEKTLRDCEGLAVLLMAGRFNETAAEHWREREGDEARNQYRHHESNNELVKEPAKDSTHEQYGNEHGSER